MFCFCLGTVPLMLLFGGVAKVLQIGWKEKMLKVSAALLVLLGLFTAQNNLVLTGLSMPVSGGGSYTEAAAADVRDGVQYVTTYLHPNGYDDIAVSAGMPVVWTIIVQEGSLNGCNKQLVIPAFGLQVSLEEGENLIAFTPVEEGSYPYSCWMGMLKNTIQVDGAG